MTRGKLYLEINIEVQIVALRLKLNLETHIFWKGLLNVREDILGCRTFKIKDGSQTRFREDIWVGSKSLKEQFPILYNIAHDPHTTVQDVMTNAFEHIF
jgi:hypothetical protein